MASAFESNLNNPPSQKQTIQINVHAALGKKETWYFKDESNTINGPFEPQTLQLWEKCGLISLDTQVFESTSNQPIPLSELISSKGLPDIKLKEGEQWTVFSESKMLFSSLNNRLNKCFSSRHQVTDLKFFNIVTPAQANTVSGFMEFEEFLEQMDEIPKEIKDLNLNQFAEPFALWVHKTISVFNKDITYPEIKQLLVETDPLKSKEFIFSRIPQEKDALNVFNSFNQWRIFIPVFEADDN